MSRLLLCVVTALAAASPTPQVRLDGFLSSRAAAEKVVAIEVEPKVVYLEQGRDASHLSFDFALTGLSERSLKLTFIKVAAYDARGALLAYRFLNRNAVGPAGIDTLEALDVEGRQRVDLYNPFHSFPRDLDIESLRYMFTFRDRKSGEEFYYGDIEVRPQRYRQQVELDLPVRGLVTVLDGHDYFSHHRRFAMTIARQVTGGAMQQNFSRYALDFVHIGADGNTRRMPAEERAQNYDFAFVDARRFYSDRAEVLAPAAGEVVVAVDGLEDLYQGSFDFEGAVKGGRVHDLAGNYVVIRHNRGEHSHLFHLLKGSVEVKVGQRVKRGQRVGRIGFSGAATTYSHLHYQLMDGPDFLTASALPVRFRQVTLVVGGQNRRLRDAVIDTGDVVLAGR